MELTLQNFSAKIRGVWEHAGFQKYFRNTGWMFFVRVFGLAISFFVGFYVARYLGPSNYGLFNYAISLVGILGFIAPLGLDGILRRELVGQGSKAGALLGTSVVLKIFGAAISIFIIFFFLVFSNIDFFTKILVFTISLSAIFQSFGVIEIFFQARVLSGKIALAQSFCYISSALIKIIFIYLKADLVYFAFLFVFDSFLLALVFVIIYKKSGFVLSEWMFDKATAISLLKSSWPLIFSAAALSIYLRIDQVMINIFLGNEAGGIYAAGVRLSESWNFIPGIICASLFPAIVNAKKVSISMYRNRMSRLYSFVIIISLFFGLLFFVGADFFVKLLYGDAFIGAARVLKVYVWSGLWMSLGMVVGQYLIVENYTKISLLLNILGAFFNFILNILLIPRMGIAGAALATFVSYFFVVFGTFLFKETRSQAIIIFKSFTFYKLFKV